MQVYFPIDAEHYRSDLAKKLHKTPKKERKELLEAQKQTPDYQKSRLFNLIDKVKQDYNKTEEISPESSLQQQRFKLRIKKILESKELYSSLSDSQVAETFLDANVPDFLQVALDNDYLSSLDLNIATRLIEMGASGGVEFYADKFDKKYYPEIIEGLINSGNCSCIKPFLTQEINLDKNDLVERIFQIDGVQVLNNLEFFNNIDPNSYILRLIEAGKTEKLTDFLYIIEDQDTLQRVINLLLDRDRSEETIKTIVLRYSKVVNEEILRKITMVGEYSGLDQIYNQMLQDPNIGSLLNNPQILESLVKNATGVLLRNILRHQEVSSELLEKLIISNPGIFFYINKNLCKNLKINSELLLNLFNYYETDEIIFEISKLSELNFMEPLSNEVIDKFLARGGYAPDILLNNKFIFKKLNLDYLIDKIVETNYTSLTDNLLSSIQDFSKDLAALNFTEEELDFFKKNNSLSLKDIIKFSQLFNSYSQNERDELIKVRVSNLVVNSEDLETILENLELFPNTNLQEIYDVLYNKDPELIVNYKDIFRRIGVDFNDLVNKLLANQKFDVILKNLNLFPQLQISIVIGLIIDTNQSKFYQDYFHLFPLEERAKVLDRLIAYGDYDKIIDNFLIFQDIERENLVSNLLTKSQKPIYEKIKILVNKKEILEVTKHLEKIGYGLVLYLSLKDSLEQLPQEVKKTVLKYRHFETETVQIDGKDYQVYDNNPYQGHPWNPENLNSNMVNLILEILGGKISLDTLSTNSEFLKRIFPSLETSSSLRFLKIIFPLLQKLRAELDQKFEEFIEKGRASNFIISQEKELIFSEGSKELINLKESILKSLAIYILQSAEGNLVQIIKLLENPKPFLENLRDNQIQVLNNEANIILYLNPKPNTALGDRSNQVTHLKSMNIDFSSLIEQALEKYLKAYEIDIPLYDVVYNEFDGYRDSGNYFQEVYLGRDGIYAKLGRRALITSMLRRIGREERIKYKKTVAQHRINPNYLIYPRFFVQNMETPTLYKYLEQNNISVDSNPIFFDTGFVGTIPENIGEVLRFDSQEIEQRIRLLSADRDSRRIKGIQENAREDIVNFIEGNSKVEGAAEGLYYDRKTGKLRHIAKPLYPEQQLFYSMIKQAIERHYWLRGGIEAKED